LFVFSIFRIDFIHEENFIHRDLHSGNILLFNGKWHIGDLGLSQPADITSSSNEIYGVIPYVAPEILNGNAFSKESDIYSMGMIMWELTTGCKLFANVEHDVNLIYKIIDGERPEITSDTPECFANLIKRCLNSDPSKRPHIKEICKSIALWLHTIRGISHPPNDQDEKMEFIIDKFNQAEKIGLELIKTKVLCPKFTSNSHLGAIYTSRSLNSWISKSLSVNSSSTTLFNTEQSMYCNFKKKLMSLRLIIIILSFNYKFHYYTFFNIFLEYISKEFEYDINDAQWY